MADLRKLKDEATAAFGKGKFAKAAELFEDLAKADPKDLQAQMKWGDALSKSGKKDRALGVYQKLAEAYAAEGFLPKAIAVCKVILEIDPAHNATQQVLAGLYAKKLGADVPMSAPKRPSSAPAAPPNRPASGAAPLAGPGIPRAHAKPAAIIPPPPPEPSAAAEPSPDDIELDRGDHAQAGFGTSPAHTGPESDLPPELDPSLYATQSAPAPAPEPAPATPDAPLELEVELSATTQSKLTIAPEPAAPPPAAPAASTAASERAPTRPSPQINWGAESSDSIEAQLESVAAAAPAAAPEPATDAVDEIDVAFEVPVAFPEEEEIELLSVTAELPKDLGKPMPKIPLFSDLTPEAFVALMEQCGLVRAEPGQVIIRQGDAGNSFFVVCSGKMKVVKNDPSGEEIVMAYLPEGAFFGEMALLSGQKRTATVIAEEESELLEISAPVLNNLVKQHPHVAASIRQFGRQRLLADVMATSALFRPFERTERKRLVELFKVREVQAGEDVVREGTATDGLYLVMNGELEVQKGGALLASMREGDIFGEMSLLSKKPASATVRAKKRSNVLRLPRERFEELIVTYPQVLVLVSELADSRTRSQAAARLAPERGAAVV